MSLAIALHPGDRASLIVLDGIPLRDRVWLDRAVEPRPVA